MATTSHDLVDVPVATFKAFARHIADHDLWDDVETHLTGQGTTSVPLSRAFIDTVTTKLGDHARAAKQALMSCGCTGGKSGGGDGGHDANKGTGGTIIPPGGTWSADGGVKGPAGGDGGSDAGG